MTEGFTGDIQVQKRHFRGRLTITVRETIDDEELLAEAERHAALSGSLKNVDQIKVDLVESAMLKCVRRKAPEAFDSNVETRLRVCTDYDVDMC